MRFLLTKLFFISCILSASATVLTVDNNPNAPTGTGIYKTVQLAYNAAQNNDTLLIIPSATSYGNLNVQKKLTIIGGGFNTATESKKVSTFGQVYLYGAASGSKLIGLKFTSYLYVGYRTGVLTNVIIENSQFEQGLQFSGTSVANVIIRQNLFNINYQGYAITASQAVSNVFVTNNVFNYASLSNRIYGFNITQGGFTIDHNLFVGVGSTNTSYTHSFYQLKNCVVSNNIFQGRKPTASRGLNGVTFKNNLSRDMEFSALTGTNLTKTGNLAKADPKFVNLPALTSGTSKFDNSVDATLQGDSPAKGKATDGTNLGVYGGSSPYKNSGAVLPYVKKFTLPTTIKQGENATANIEVSGK